MRSLILLFASALCAFPQISAGIKAGVPLTDFFSTVQSPNFGFNSNTKRYIIGPTVQLNLPAGFAVEFDALYRRLNYEASGTLLDVFTNQRTTGNAWEFPLLLKYRFPAPVARPFVSAGVAWDTLSGVKQSISNLSGSLISNDNPAELRNNTTTGFVMGAGVEVRALLIRLVPEVRYTRWGSQHFTSTNGLSTNRNQAEFLLGIQF